MNLPTKLTVFRIILTFVIIFLLWIPTVLAFYPGLLNYDGPIQIITYLANKMSHHPILSTVYMGICYTTGINAGNTSFGVILYSLSQMISGT